MFSIQSKGVPPPPVSINLDRARRSVCQKSPRYERACTGQGANGKDGQHGIDWMAISQTDVRQVVTQWKNDRANPAGRGLPSERAPRKIQTGESKQSERRSDPYVCGSGAQRAHPAIGWNIAEARPRVDKPKQNGLENKQRLRFAQWT